MWPQLCLQELNAGAHLCQVLAPLMAPPAVHCQNLNMQHAAQVVLSQVPRQEQGGLVLPQRPLLLEKHDLEVGVLAGCQTGDNLLQAPDELQELAACRWSSTCLLTGNPSQ